MELKTILYSYKIRDFNISKDLNYISFNNGTLYVADINKCELHKIMKNNRTYVSTFSEDNSFAVFSDHSSLFALNDNFSKKKVIRMTGKDSMFWDLKPVINKDSFYYVLREYENSDIPETLHKDRPQTTITTEYIYQYTINKKQLLFKTNNVYMCNNEIYNDILYELFVENHCQPGKQKKLHIYVNNLKTKEENVLHYSFDKNISHVHNAVVLPQKNLLICVCSLIKDDCSFGAVVYSLELETFKIVNETKLEQELTLVTDLVSLCSGKYVAFQYNTGFLVINTDNLSIEKDIYFPRIRGVRKCDNDRFCFIRAWEDYVLFTPEESPENNILINKIEKCFNDNGLGKYLIK